MPRRLRVRWFFLFWNVRRRLPLSPQNDHGHLRRCGRKIGRKYQAEDQGASMHGGRSSRFNVFHVAVVLACGGLLAACSQSPQQPAPVFALPLSKIVGAPAVDGQTPAQPAAQPATRQLRYVAVPPGRQVSGMAHAHVILKRASAASHRSIHPRKSKAGAHARAIGPAAAPRSQTKAGGGEPAAAIPLDQPAPTEAAEAPPKL